MDKEILAGVEPAALYEAFEKTSGCGFIFIGPGGAGSFADSGARAALQVDDDDEGGCMAYISPVLSELRSGADFAEKDIAVASGGKTRTLKASGANLGGAGENSSSLIAIHDVTSAREHARLQSEFVSHVSHELRTPLTTMKEFASILLDGLAGEITEKQKKYLGIIHNNIARLAKIVDDLLDISKLEAGKIKLAREPVSVERLLKQACFFLGEYVAGRQMELVCESRGELPRVYADADRIIQVATNLIENAVKHSPPGGKIVLGAEPVEGFVKISVSDEGEGISPEDHEKVFDRFQQLGLKYGPGYKGVGLGLAIARQIVLMHGGKICVDSEPGRGSVFTLTLPAAREAENLAGYLEENIQLSRMLDRKFSLLRIRPRTDGGTLDRLGPEVKKLLRKATDSDPIVSDNSLFIGLPGTDGPQAGALAERLGESLPRELSEAAEFTAAVFPEDGGSAEELLRKTIAPRPGGAG